LAICFKKSLKNSQYDPSINNFRFLLGKLLKRHNCPYIFENKNKKTKKKRKEKKRKISKKIGLLGHLGVAEPPPLAI
jgi:hypothetical protein